MNRWLALIIIGVLCIAAPASASHHDMLQKLRQADLIVSSANSGSNEHTLILIEDAHANYQAQKEIADILHSVRMLCDTMPPVAVEGSSGPIMTHFLSALPDMEQREKIADYFLKKAIIAGEEYCSAILRTPLSITGVEDPPLYKAALEQFRSCYAARTGNRECLTVFHTALSSVRAEVYNERLMQFDTLCRAYAAGRIDISEFVTQAQAIAPESVRMLESLPVLAQFLALKTEQTAMDFSIVSMQADMLSAFLMHHESAAVAGKARPMILAAVGSSVPGPEYYVRLRQFAVQSDAYNPKIYKLFESYVHNYTQLRTIDYRTLQNQLERFRDVCYDRLIMNEREQTVCRLARNADIIDALCSLSLTRNQFEQMPDPAALLTKFNTSFPDYALDSGSCKELVLLADSYRNFYYSAVAREQALFENTMQMLDKAEAHTGVLIAGGFHRDALIRACQDNDVSCLVITPRMANEHDFARYAAVLLREDIFPAESAGFGSQSYIRATSYFAQNSFDDQRSIARFHAEIVGQALIGFVAQAGPEQVYGLFDQWRRRFMTLIAHDLKPDSVEYEHALRQFVSAVTDSIRDAHVITYRDRSDIMLISRHDKYFFAKDAAQRIISTSQPWHIGMSDPIIESAVRADAEDMIDLFINADLHYMSVDGQRHFLDTAMHPFMQRLFIAAAHNSMSAVQIRDLFAQAGDYLISHYTIRIKIADADHAAALSTTFAGTVKNFIEAIELPAPGHMLLPLSAEDTLLFEHIHAARQPLDFEPGRREEVHVEITVLNPIEKQRLISVLRDVEYAQAMLETAGVAEQFATDIQQVKLNVDSLQEFSAQLAHALLDRFRAVAVRYEAEFVADGYPAGLAGLSAYYAHLTGTGTDSTLVSDISEIVAPLNPEHSAAKTAFFKGFTPMLTDRALEEIDVFLQHLIQQKVAFDDRTLSLRTIGIATGEEAYILAAMAESALLEYARTYIYPNDFRAANRWVDSWDVRVYACDATPVSLAIAHVGHYRVNRSEIDALAHAENRYGIAIGSVSDYSSLDRAYRFVTRSRLKKWIIPIVTPMTPQITDMLRDRPAEITVFNHVLNTLPNRQDQQAVLEAILDSSNPQYPAFIRSDELPQHLLADAPYMELPSQRQRSLGEIHRAARMHSVSDLDSFMLLVGDGFELSPLVHTYFAMHERAYTLMQQADASRINTAEGQEAFIVQAMDRQIMQIMREGDNDPSQRLRVYGDILSEAYLDVFGTTERAASFAAQVDATVESIRYNGERIYLPITLAGEQLYRRYAPDAQEYGGSGRFTLVNAHVMQRDILNAQDAPLISALLETLQKKVPDKLQDFSSIDELYIDTTRALFYHLVQEYKPVLLERYGDASLVSLQQYISDVPAEDIDDLVQTFSPISFVPGITYFFRHARYWPDFIPQTKTHLRNVILQKYAQGDYTLPIQSIGASTGKEAYSIAAITEHVLFEIGTELFGYREDSDRFIQDWIDSWDVRIFAIELHRSRFQRIVEGVYSIDTKANSSEQPYFNNNTEYWDMFDADIGPLLALNCFFSVRIKPRLKRWVQPVLCDIVSYPDMLSELPTVMTFYMNTHKHVSSSQAAERIRSVVCSQHNPYYQTAVFMNTMFDEPPIIVVEHAVSPYANPATQLPNTERIMGVAQIIGQYDEESLAVLFGIPLDRFIDCIDADACPSLHPSVTPLRQRIDTLLAQWDNEQLLNPEQQQLIVMQMFESELQNVFRRNGISKGLMPWLRIFGAALSDAYADRISSVGIQVSGTVFSQNIDHIVNNIQVIQDSVYLPVRLDRRPVFREYRITGPEDGVLEFVRIVHPNSVQRRLDELAAEDSIAALQKTIITKIADMVSHANSLADEDKRPIQFILQEVSAQLLSDIMADDVSSYTTSQGLDDIVDSILLPTPADAPIIRPFFEYLVLNYHDILLERYGAANLNTLREYIASLQFESPLSEAEHDILRFVRFFYRGGHESQTTPDSTYFFRLAFKWPKFVKKTKEILLNLVILKYAMGDYTLPLSSLGASHGREAYSLACLTEQVLIEFAESLFEDAPDRGRLIQDWVDSWDVKIYALEREGERIESIVKGEYVVPFNLPSGIHPEARIFLDNPTLDTLFETTVDGSPSLKYNALLRIKKRLRDWVQPVFCDFSGDPYMIRQIPSLFTFYLNTHIYLTKYAPEQAEKVATVVRELNDPDYPSTLFMNIQLDATPEKINRKGNAPYTHPPSEMPDAGKIMAVAQVLGEFNIHKIAAIFAVLPKDIDKALAANQSLSFKYVTGSLQQRVEQLVAQWNISDMQQVDNQRQLIEHAMDDEVKRMMNLNLSHQHVTQWLRVFGRILSAAYRDRVSHLPEGRHLSRTFSARVEQLVSGIDVFDAKVFMPTTFEGRPVYTVYTIDQTLTGLSVLSWRIHPNAFERLQREEQDIPLVRSIFQSIIAKLQPLYSEKLRFHGDDTIFARQLLYYLVEKYSQPLTEQFGSANLQTLRKYIDALPDTQAEGIGQELEVFRFILINRNSSQKVAPGTCLFRHALYWPEFISETKRHLRSVILQKYALGDYTLPLQSVGASIGKEAYTLAAIVHQVLTEVGSDLFRGRENVEQLVEEWIQTWDIVIYAVELEQDRLRKIYEGRYTLYNVPAIPGEVTEHMAKEWAFIDNHPELQSIFELDQQTRPVSDTAVPIVVRPQFRQWVKPVFADICENQGMLGTLPSVLTLYMNTYRHLITRRPEEAEKLKEVLLSQRDSRYPSALFMNVEHNQPPVILHPESDLPYTAAPAILPSPSRIAHVAQRLAVYDEDRLAEIFGISREQLDAILSATHTAVSRRLSRSHELVDSML